MGIRFGEAAAHLAGIEQPVLPGRDKVGVEQLEIADAPRDDGLAIQDQVLRRQGPERSGDRLKRRIQS
jgi:hypothetical protein